jgi:hypothetical protein
MHCEASPGNGAGGGVSNLRWGARVKRIYGAAGFDTNGRPDKPVGSRRARDPGEATAIVSGIYLPNRLVLPRGVSEVDMELRGYELGAVTVGRLEYGKNLLQVTGDCQNFHVTMPLHGRALSTHGGGDVVATIAGQCLVFSPGAPAELRWSFDCVQLCVMLSRHAVEDEFERLLGTRPNNMLRFDFGARARENLGQRWRTMLRLLIEEIEHPTGIMAGTPVGRHMEAMLIDGLLLAHPHNRSDELLRPAAPGASVTVRRAVDLMESPARGGMVGGAARRCAQRECPRPAGRVPARPRPTTHALPQAGAPEFGPDRSCATPLPTRSPSAPSSSRSACCTRAASRPSAAPRSARTPRPRCAAALEPEVAHLHGALGSTRPGPRSVDWLPEPGAASVLRGDLSGMRRSIQTRRTASDKTPKLAQPATYPTFGHSHHRGLAPWRRLVLVTHGGTP